MHIPASPTKELTIVPFESALSDALCENDEYDIRKWLYVPPVYGEYRYILGTRGKHPLLCIGINPSTAAPDRLDNTLKSVERIAAHNGFDSFMMFNVYAQRATDPDDMEYDFNPLLHTENLKAFAYALSESGTRPTVWAAWGAIIEKRAYLPALIRDFYAVSEKYGAQWVSCGKISKKGHPHHPLYLPTESSFADFDIDRYLENLSALSFTKKKRQASVR